ncbi:gene transfer agent family protein [Oceanicella actignis]|uniref:Phage tail tube protein, GTA-gp10 n=1 Tax=Oceanicella actignis TaxID=1189325 RepID=A0A1M7TZU9_9RHOB|nr:gene transfer agent family protein [Oceanicella actignis]SET83520.1 Phage tail tube protein, GTA-gp10 [Oceanicella actignis]SHN76225.1 Phage tail tube protein, GTA-gp10 [Oceanicella actignis]
MANPARGEVEIVLDGRPHVMRLTLGALAELEAALGAEGLVGLARRFEEGSFSAADLLRLIGAGLRGAGASISDQELGAMRIEGGVHGAARAAARLLEATFAPLEEMG